MPDLARAPSLETPEKQLYNLLIERYGSERAAREDLRRDLARWPGCEDLEAELPTALTSPAHQVQALIDALVSRRLVGTDLFARLAETGFPMAALGKLATAWGAAPQAADDSKHRSSPEGHAALPPGTPFRPEYYVGWGLAEKRALQQIRFAGSPVVLFGPPRVGKTWFLEHLLAEVAERMGDRVAIYRINLDDTTEADRSDYGAFLQWLTVALLGPGRADQVPALWEGAVNLNSRLAEILRTQVLEPGPQMVVLAIDRADRVRLCSFNDDFYSMVRARARDSAAPWDKLRLVMSLSASPEEMTGELNASVFYGLSRPELLEGFDDGQIGLLAGQYGLPEGASPALTLATSGERRPYHLRAALFERSLAEVTDDVW